MTQEARSLTESEEWGEGTAGLWRKEKEIAETRENSLGKRLTKGRSFASILEAILCLKEKNLCTQRKHTRGTKRVCKFNHLSKEVDFLKSTLPL